LGAGKRRLPRIAGVGGQRPRPRDADRCPIAPAPANLPRTCRETTRSRRDPVTGPPCRYALLLSRVFKIESCVFPDQTCRRRVRDRSSDEDTRRARGIVVECRPAQGRPRWMNSHRPARVDMIYRHGRTPDNPSAIGRETGKTVPSASVADGESRPRITCLHTLWSSSTSRAAATCATTLRRARA